ncbi:MAG TPA: hypothetical protein EYQ08_07645 [Planctomycetes bacterium]|nr:hypothetical protein [Planctomycetota bacterium]HIK81937.1 hypothetical protein [Planctomycetota bacterium]
MLYCDDCGSITDKNHGPDEGSVHCPRCAGATEESPATSGLSLLDEPASTQPTSKTSTGFGAQDLDLYSSETIAQKRQRKTPTGETKLHLVSDEVDDFSTEPEPPIESVAPSDDSTTQNFTTQNFSAPQFPSEEFSSDDSGSPESTSARWRFECLACSGTLSVEPVTTRSKVGCPRCQTKMVLSPDGEVTLPKIHTSKPTSAPSETPAPLFGGAETSSDRFEQFETSDDLFSTTEDSTPSPFTTAPQEGAVSAPSMAALKAAGEPCNSDGEVITMAPVSDPEVETAESITDAPELPLEFQPQLGVETSLGFLDEVTIAGATFEPLDGEESTQEQVEPSSYENGTTLQPATVVLWSGLFALPSLAALLITHAPKSSALWGVMTRAGISFQTRCGELLDQLAPWMGSF